MTNTFGIIGWTFALVCTIRLIYLSYWYGYWKATALLRGAKEQDESWFTTLKELMP